jgi:glutamate-ammonia-ligase adenylyltransferase
VTAQRERESREGRLARLGFVDAPAVERDLEVIGGDRAPLVSDLAQAADPDLAVRSLARLVRACGRDAEALRSSLAVDPLLRLRLAKVLGGSAAIADHFARHPSDWRELADPLLDLDRPDAVRLRHLLGAAADANDLRRIYRRLLVRLIARDLTGTADVVDVAAELADLAAAAIDGALGLARKEMGAARLPYRLAVIGLGKCGGRELNYVSDVDVLFVAEPVADEPEQAALNAAVAAATTMMRICSDHTEEGTLWPVDAGLRPEGKAGQLVRTLSSHEAYYRRWAKTWEFQALLKARPIAGDLGLG